MSTTNEPVPNDREPSDPTLASETLHENPPTCAGGLSARTPHARTDTSTQTGVLHTPELEAGPLPAIPGYEIVGEIARGGMGVVYEAKQPALNRPAAIKLILGGKYHDASVQLRFLIEAEAIAQLQHKNVVQVYEFGQHEGMPFLVMEYVDGGTLAQRLVEGKAYTPAEAAVLMEKLAAAMTAAHAKGIVHRDLKPSNVLLTADGEPKVSDFGLAKVGDSGVTASDAVLGTPSHMSPEQAAGRVREVGTASDVWALGCILYRLLTGRLPFEGDSPAATIHQVLYEVPPRPRTLVPNVPRDLETICLECLQKNPGKRYPTADALAADLRAYLDGRPIAARPVGWVERSWMWAKRHPGRAAVAVVGFLLVVGSCMAAQQVDRALAAQQAESERLQRELKADSLVQALTRADPAGVPIVLNELEDYRELARPTLQRMASDPVRTKRGLLARYALLPYEPHRLDELLEYATECPPDELPLFTRLSGPHVTAASTALWPKLSTPWTNPHQQLRITALLAAWETENPKWKSLAVTVVDHLVRVNARDVDAYLRAFHPIRRVLVPVLMKRYAESLGRFGSAKIFVPELVPASLTYDVTATLLAAYTADDPQQLLDFAVTVDERHYPLVAEHVNATRAALVPELSKELVAGGQQLSVQPIPLQCGGAGVWVGSADCVYDAFARRRGFVAALLLRYHRPERVWPLICHSPDPTVRSYLLSRIAVVGVDPAVLAHRHAVETDLSMSRALILALGDYRLDQLEPFTRDELIRRLVSDYRSHPDPGLHSAIEWLLCHRWGLQDLTRASATAEVNNAIKQVGMFGPTGRAVIGPAAVMPRPLAPSAGRGWYVNTQGQTFVRVTGPNTSVVGSPETEPHRQSPRETSRRVRLPHTFTITTREVTNEQFRRFNPNHRSHPDYSPYADSPVCQVTFHQAAAYCNWLSEQDGIPRHQWCYKPNADGEYAAGMIVRRDRLALQGYRLPTEAEWELACRAGATTARSFGRGRELLSRYGWYMKSADEHAHPVGRLRPNDWGLFDMHGNVWELCEDAAILDTPGAIVSEYWRTNPLVRRVIRGGSYVDEDGAVRAANRNSYRPMEGNLTIGFRPVRTLTDEAPGSCHSLAP